MIFLSLVSTFNKTDVYCSPSQKWYNSDKILNAQQLLPYLKHSVTIIKIISENINMEKML